MPLDFLHPFYGGSDDDDGYADEDNCCDADDTHDAGDDDGYDVDGTLAYHTYVLQCLYSHLPLPSKMAKRN